MKWLWHHRDESAPTPHAPSHTGGEVAHAHAAAGLAAQRARQPEVDRVAESLRELRQRNHFAAQIRMIFQGGQPE